ncbi:UDP-2,3-diacylglucosamine hydrolase [Hydromonas duriensis]|uniref:UDP-2,3-diacylglucosamine hydrolase n=2 Tax=Hydromonas duriensis TaxID=1527608 RepID=A0A4V3DK10_9BURK|nr:UDP-2,3-diacylglucosamine hydrolase [Hydromonas duriensis]
MNNPHPTLSRPMDTSVPSELSGVCFISDLHLSVNMPRTLAQFEYFCETIAPQYNALIILGDLFEYWVGDDAALENPAAQRVAESLSKLAQSGIFIGYMVGNRDFLVREEYTAFAHMTPLPDPCVITINHQRVLLTHGDLMCSHEKGYQLFRRLVHTSWIQNVFLKLPLSWRNQLAKKIRNTSKQREYKTHDNMQIQDIPAHTAEAWFKTYASRYIIHGHTHQPSTHLTFDTTRVVLPDWECENPDKIRWGYISWLENKDKPELIVITQ